MKTIVYGKQPLSPEAKAFKVRLEADPEFRRNREVFAKMRNGTATANDRVEYQELMRPFRAGRQDVVRG
jgi:hypothetical protein